MKERNIVKLKRWLKNRRRITEALIVTFLITGSIGYGATYEVTTDGTILTVGSNESYNEGIVVSANDIIINNSGILKNMEYLEVDSDGNQTAINKGNGIDINIGSVEENKVIISNTGIIYGSSLGSSFQHELGNGISINVNSRDLDLLVIDNNVGIISGSLNSELAKPFQRFHSSGNGIFAPEYSGFHNMVVDNNSGIISGSVNYRGMDSPQNVGNGVSFNNVIIDNNDGIISGNSNIEVWDYISQPVRSGWEPVELVGNGISSSNVTINNNGIISGSLNLITEIFPAPSILGNGISGQRYNMGNNVVIDNNSGIISGRAELYASIPYEITFIGNGVYGGEYSLYFEEEEKKTIINNNTGIISGNVFISEIPDEFGYPGMFLPSLIKSGNGVSAGYTYDSSEGAIITNNSGIISGSGTTSYKSEDLDGELIILGNGIDGILEVNSGLVVGNYRTEVIKGGITSRLSGNGVAFKLESMLDDSNTSVFSINLGLIGGSGSAIALTLPDELETNIVTTTNYGILAGREIISDGVEIVTYESGEVTENEGIDKPLKDIRSEIDYKNYGIEVKLNGNGDGTVVSVVNGLTNTTDETEEELMIDDINYTIINTGVVDNTDSYKTISSIMSYENHIINGAGVASGTLTIDNTEVTLTNSIINGYEKAVTIKDGGALTATDTIFNGGGVGTWVDIEDEDGKVNSHLEYTNVIEGDSGDNTINLSGNSIVNGKVALGSGDDTIILNGTSIINGGIYLEDGNDIINLSGDSTINKIVDLGGGDDIASIENTVQINDDILGGEGNDTLNLGSSSTANTMTRSTVNYDNSLKVYHTINGFENINVKGSVILYETAKIEDGGLLYIDENSSLNLRIDPTITDDNDRVTGHGLFESNTTVSGYYLTEEDGLSGIEDDTTAGTLNLVTSGVGIGGVIAMDGVTLDDKLYVRTDSLIHKAEKLDNGDIEIGVEQDFALIFPDRSYEKIDGIYESLVSSGNKNVNKLYLRDRNINTLYTTVNLNDKTEAEARENLFYLLNDIFMANPYGYVSRSSHETFGLFNESILSDKFKPNKGNWLIYGNLNIGGSDYDNYYDNHFVGNYYGFDTEKVVINSESRNYGGYGKAEYGLTDKTSAGIMVGGANSKTDISNGSKLDGDLMYLGGYGKTEINNFRLVGGVGYQYGNFDTTRIAKNDYQSFKHEEDMKTDSFGVYGGVTYEHSIGEKWSVEPNLSLRYTNVKQSSVDEGESILGISVDSENKGYLDGEIGLDVVRTVRYNDRLAKIRAGVSYSHSLEGADASYVTGRFQGSSDFDILLPEESEGKAKVKASYDVEYDSGVVFNVEGGYTSGKNASDYYVGVGVGYKFNNLKDFIPQKNTVIEEPVEIEEKEVVEILEEGEVTATRILGGFALNSAVLTDEIKVELDKLVEKLKDSDTEEIKIIGYTDSTGPARFNEVLSLERAKSAKRYLEARLELIEEIQTEGRGPADPIESNATPEGRRQNRRIRVEY